MEKGGRCQNQGKLFRGRAVRTLGCNQQTLVQGHGQSQWGKKARSGGDMAEKAFGVSKERLHQWTGYLGGMRMKKGKGGGGAKKK